MSQFEDKQNLNEGSRGESATAVLERPLDPAQSQDLDQEIHGSTIEISDISEMLISNQAAQNAQAADERDDMQHAQTQAAEALAHHSPAPVALVGGTEVDHATRQVREVVNQERIEDKVRRDAKALAVERKEEADREGERLLPTADSAIGNEADKNGTSASGNTKSIAQGDRISADRTEPDASQKTGIADPRDATRSEVDVADNAEPELVISAETRKVLEQGYKQSVAAAALDCALVSDYYSRPNTKAQLTQHVDLLSSRYGILGTDREQIERDLQKASQDIAADFAKLSAGAKEELRNAIDQQAYSLMRDPTYPSIEALENSKREIAESLAHSKNNSKADVAIMLRLFNQNGDTLMASIAHGAALRSVAATQGDLDYVNSFADKRQFQSSAMDTSEFVGRQLDELGNRSELARDRGAKNRFESNKIAIERLVTKIGEAGSADSAESVEFGGLDKQLRELELNADAETRKKVLPQVRALLARAELRLQAVDGQYLDSHLAGNAEENVVKNLGYIGIGDAEVELKLQSFARGANLLNAQRQLKQIDSDYVKFGDHHYDSDSKQFVVGAGSRKGRDVTRKGKREEMSEDAALALRHCGFEGAELGQALSGFLGHVEGRYNQAKLGVESSALASVESLRKQGATAVELTGDPKNPVKVSTAPAPEASATYAEFLKRYSAFGAVEIDDDALADLKKSEIKAGRGESSIIVQQAVVTKAWFDEMKAKDDDFEAEEANAEQLAELSRRIYLIGAPAEETSKKIEAADFKKMNEMADLQQVVTSLSRRGQAVPYLAEAAQYFQGNLPANEAERMLLEAKARESVKFCEEYLAREKENAKERQYERAGGWIGMTAWTATESVDGFFSGLSAGWVSPKRWGMALNHATTGGADKDAYADLQGAYNNLDGAAGVIAHGSRHVSEIGGMATGAFYGAGALQGVRVAGVGLRVGGQAGRVALAMGAQQALKADDNLVQIFNEKGELDFRVDISKADLGGRAKAGGMAYAQGLLFSYGTQWVAKGAGAVGSKMMPQSVASALEGSTVGNIAQRGVEIMKQSGGSSYAGRMVVGAGVNVVSDAAVALATGHEITGQQLVDSAVFGAVFEGLGVHSQRAKAAQEAAPSRMEQIEKFSPETHQKILELNEMQSRLAETQGPGKLKQAERPAVEAEVSRRQAELEGLIGPGRLERALSAPIDGTVKLAKETAQASREVGGAIEDGIRAVDQKITAAEDLLLGNAEKGIKSAPDRVIDLAKQGGKATVEAAKSGGTAVRDGANAVFDGVNHGLDSANAAFDKGMVATIEAPGKALNATGRAISKGAEAVRDGTVQAGKATVEAAKSGGTAVRDGATAVFDGVNRGIDSANVAFDKGMAATIEAPGKAIDATGRAIKEGASYADQKLTAAEDLLLGNAEKGIKSAPDRVIDLAKQGGKATVEAAKSGGAAVRDGATAVFDGVNRGIDSANAAFDKGMAATIEAPGKAIDATGRAISKGAEAVRDGTVQAGKAIKDGAISVKDGAVAAKDAVVQTAKDVGGAVKDGAINLKNSAVKAVKDGVTSVRDGVTSEIRQIKVEYLTRHTDRSPQAIEAANKFLDLEATLDKSPDAAARLKTLREMAVQNRTLKNEAALTDVRADLSSLTKSVLERGIKGQGRPDYQPTSQLGDVPRVPGLSVSTASSNAASEQVGAPRELSAAELESAFAAESYNGPRTPESRGYVDSTVAELESAFKADSYSGKASPESSNFSKPVDPEVAALEAAFKAESYEPKQKAEVTPAAAQSTESSMADFEASFKAESYKGDQTPEAALLTRESIAPERLSSTVDRIPDTWDELFTKMERKSKPVETAPESAVATKQEAAKAKLGVKEQSRLETRQSELTDTKNQLEGELYELRKEHELLGDEYAQMESQQVIDELSNNLKSVEKELARIDKKLAKAAKSVSESPKLEVEQSEPRADESVKAEEKRSSDQRDEISRAQLEEQAMDLGRRISDARESMRSAQNAEEFTAAETELTSLQEQMDGIKGRLGSPKAKPQAVDPVQELKLNSNSDGESGGENGGKGGSDSKPEVEKPRWMREDSGSDWRSDSNGPDDGGGVAVEQEVKTERKLKTLTKTEVIEEALVEEAKPEEAKPKEEVKVDSKKAAEEAKQAAEERISKLSPKEALQEKQALEQQKADLEQLQKELHRKLNREADPIAKEKVREEIMKLSKTRKQTVFEIETIEQRLAREVKPEPKQELAEELTVRAEPELQPEPLAKPMPQPEVHTEQLASVQPHPQPHPEPHPQPHAQARPMPFPKPIPQPLDELNKQRLDQETLQRRRDDDRRRRGGSYTPNEHYEDPDPPPTMGHWDSSYGTERNRYWNPNQLKRRFLSEKAFQLGERTVKKHGHDQGVSPLYSGKLSSGVVLSPEGDSSPISGNSDYATVLEVTELSKGTFLNIDEVYEG